MRLSKSLLVANAIFMAAPAVAQDDNAAQSGTAVTNGADGNMVVVNGPPVAAAPASSTAPADSTAAPVKTHHGFPFGVIGLVGLIGLLGVRKVKA